MSSFVLFLNNLVYVFLQICFHIFVGELPRSVITGPKVVPKCVMETA